MSRVTLVAAELIVAGCAKDSGYERRNGDISVRDFESKTILNIQKGE